MKTMLLLADSGSTKTDWCLISKSGDEKYFQTIGLNPYFVDESMVDEILSKELDPFFDKSKVEFVHFFGSGCANDSKKMVLQYSLEHFFSTAEVFVESDLIGAAQALCGKEKGLVCILGTGSSSCLYDGQNIIDRRPSLGYLLGDHGSAASLGLHLLSDFLHQDMPEHLQNAFAQECPYLTPDILDRVYKGPFPNRFLGGFAKFLFEHKEEMYAKNLVTKAFETFFEKQILRYPNFSAYPIHFVGSTAYWFSNLIHEVAQKNGLQIQQIVQRPMDGLKAYYKPLFVEQAQQEDIPDF
ncbi:MAG: hypothetical protein RSC04_05405 [Bacteroidales bacterium]